MKGRHGSRSAGAFLRYHVHAGMFQQDRGFCLLAKICGEYGGYLTSHIRGEGNSLTESVKEVLEIGERAGVPVNISHLKVTGLKKSRLGESSVLSGFWRRPAGEGRTLPRMRIPIPVDPPRSFP